MPRQSIETGATLILDVEHPSGDVRKALLAASAAIQAAGISGAVRMMIETEFRCDACSAPWTEPGDYNRGCCARDEANDPDRLRDLRKLAERVEEQAADAHRCDEDGRPEKVADGAASDFATDVLAWLKAGRPTDKIGDLEKRAQSVRRTDWVTIWTDPGVYPSGAGGSPLPDQANRLDGPEALADDVMELLLDMRYPR